MRLVPQGLAKARQPSFLLLVLLVITLAARASSEPVKPESAQAITTDATKPTENSPPTAAPADTTISAESSAAATTGSTTSSTTSTSSTSTSDTSTETSTSSQTASSTMATTTSTSTTTSSTSTDTTTTSSTSTTSSSTSSAMSSTAANGYPIITVPPTANAPYMQTTNIPEGTVFIAVGAALGLIGLCVLAWRAMVAWSVNRSVRRAAMMHASESKRLLRGRKKRSTVYSVAPAASMSLDKLGPGTRANYNKSNRVPSTNSGLFFSPTAGGGAGSHASLPGTSNRGSSYLPAGYYAAAGSSTPARGGADVPHGNSPYSPPGGAVSSPPGYPPGSPSLPPMTPFHEPLHNPRQSHLGASTSSLNLSQPPQGRAPSAYLEDLFESHVPPHYPDAGSQ